MEPEIQQFVAHQISDFNISSFEEGAKVEVTKKDDSDDSKTDESGDKKTRGATDADTKENRTEQEERMMKDTIRMISERIIDGKVDLYWWYVVFEYISHPWIQTDEHQHQQVHAMRTSR